MTTGTYIRDFNFSWIDFVDDVMRRSSLNGASNRLSSTYQIQKKKYLKMYMLSSSYKLPVSRNKTIKVKVTPELIYFDTKLGIEVNLCFVICYQRFNSKYLYLLKQFFWLYFYLKITWNARFVIIPKISLQVPASVLAILRGRICLAILIMSSMVRFPLCFTER